MVHVRLAGCSYDFKEQELNIVSSMSDKDIKQSVAQHFDLGLGQLDEYVVDRRPNGNLIVRPEAVYG